MNPPFRYNIPGVVYPDPPPQRKRLLRRFTPQQKAEIEAALLNNWKLKAQADAMGLTYSSVASHARKRGWKMIYLSKEERAHIAARRERQAARAAA